MKKAFLILLLLACAQFAVAADYEHIPETFFTYIAKGETDQAIDYLYGTNKWVAKNSDQVVNLKSQLARLQELVGSYLFHELIVEKRVGGRYAHLIYLVGYERQPLRYEIKVYKAEKGWRFQGVSFDASLTDDIEKQANLRLLE